MINCDENIQLKRKKHTLILQCSKGLGLELPSALAACFKGATT
jgi:hypothetical protein